MFLLEAVMTQTHAITLKQKHFSMVCSTLLLILNMSYCIIFIVKMTFPQLNRVGEPLFCYDDVTSCGDVSSRAVYSCD